MSFIWAEARAAASSHSMASGLRTSAMPSTSSMRATGMIASANGHAMLANFLMLAGVKWEPRKKGLKLPNVEKAPRHAATA